MDISEVAVGNTVRLRDGRYLELTDVAADNPYDMPRETIIVGRRVYGGIINTLTTRQYGGSVVTDVSEVEFVV